MANNTNYLEIQDAIIVEESEKKHCPFILGNTIEIDMQSLEDDYLVPVFSRDNNQTISHTEFINTVSDAAQTFFQGEQLIHYAENTRYVEREPSLRRLVS